MNAGSCIEGLGASTLVVQAGRYVEVSLFIDQELVEVPGDLAGKVGVGGAGGRREELEARLNALVHALETEMLRLHVARRLSERHDDPEAGAKGSIDKLLMTWVEQSVGTAAREVSAGSAATDMDDELLKTYLYSRSQSVMGGTSQIQKNLIATRVLDLPSS